MQQFFAGSDYTGARFHWLGTAHIVAIGVIFLAGLSLWFVRTRFSPQHRQFFRYGLAMLLLVNETAYHLWRWQTRQWTLQTMLPLHLCSVMVFGGAAMLIFKNYALYQFMYFMGIGAATQAMLTPDAGIYGYPHFRFFEIFISHGGIVLSALYMTFVEGFRPTWKSIGHTMLWLNVYAACVGVVNALLGSNYLWIARKPDFPTLIDLLGPWPWYILPLELISLSVCVLLYLPFVVRDWRHRYGETRND